MTLTRTQIRLLNSIEDVTIYVFSTKKGGYSFGEDKDSTCARVYTTQTAKSLIKRNLCEIEFCYVEGSLDNCVGVLRRVC